ncbi:hypothetical protein WICMUC_004508 [Wickerhamomyces mucosus]|uniref:Uncharacterized protein n=1 Tax=Wickerhamomyces mucosus TaxID=1378264 RepID=A0A9P8TAK5_9ASCO|nr:hypothetical protein WICMUC_004508 [Wickerhamomyces mucosus]
MAAPIATASSGLTALDGSLLNNDLTVSTTFGILVIPPTKITSPTSEVDNEASFKAFLTGSTVLLIKSSTKPSNCDLETFKLICFGPEASAVMKGKLISVVTVDDNSILAFSEASLIL